MGRGPSARPLCGGTKGTLARATPRGSSDENTTTWPAASESRDFALWRAVARFWGRTSSREVPPIAVTNWSEGAQRIGSWPMVASDRDPALSGAGFRGTSWRGGAGRGGAGQAGWGGARRGLGGSRGGAGPATRPAEPAPAGC